MNTTRDSRERHARLIEALPHELRPQTAPQVWQTALSLLPEEPGRALVVGAGRGGLSQILSELGWRTTSVDIHPEHFRAPGLQCQEADACKEMPFPDQSFDLLLGIEVIEHLENPWNFMREATRVLKRDGRIILSTPNVDSFPSRLLFLLSGFLPYFRDASFTGCYHVTPVFGWLMRRFCMVAGAEIVATRFSRPGWPNRRDLPRRKLSALQKLVFGLLPNNRSFGEIAVHLIAVNASASPVCPGVHTP